MKLHVGDSAPAFKLQDINGDRVSLEAYRGRPVFLSFFKWATCPLCNLRLRSLVNEFPQLSQNGLQIIGVFHSKADKLLRHMDGKNVPFPLIADPKMTLYKQYGVNQSMLGVLRGSLRMGDFARVMGNGLLKPDLPDVSLRVIPANFLIDAQGIIRTAYYGKDIGDHLPLANIKEFAGLAAAV